MAKHFVDPFSLRLPFIPPFPHCLRRLSSSQCIHTDGTPINLLVFGTRRFIWYIIRVHWFIPAGRWIESSSPSSSVVSRRPICDNRFLLPRRENNWKKNESGSSFRLRPLSFWVSSSKFQPFWIRNVYLLSGTNFSNPGKFIRWIDILAPVILRMDSRWVFALRQFKIFQCSGVSNSHLPIPRSKSNNVYGFSAHTTWKSL